MREPCAPAETTWGQIVPVGFVVSLHEPFAMLGPCGGACPSEFAIGQILSGITHGRYAMPVVRGSVRGALAALAFASVGHGARRAPHAQRAVRRPRTRYGATAAAVARAGS